jgi:hypothetical protein
VPKSTVLAPPGSVVLITISEFAAIRRVSTKHARVLSKRPGFPSPIPGGGQPRWLLSEINNYLRGGKSDEAS